MKRIKIYAHTIGLVFRKGHYLKVLQEGVHWIRFQEEVRLYDITKTFQAPVSLDILLQDDLFQSLTEVVEIGDQEVGIYRRNGNFQQVLMPGRYVFWKSIVENSFQIFDKTELTVPETIDTVVLKQLATLRLIKMYSVESYEKGLLLVEGEIQRELGAGLYSFWENIKAVSVVKADLRPQQIEVAGQEILTKDKAALRVNFHAQYRITEVEKAIVSTKDLEKQLYLLFQLALRDYIGTLTLDELLARKQAIQTFVMDQLADKVATYGVELMSCGIRDIILPGEVKEIMNQVLVAEKKAQANIITRREETASTRSLLNTAKLMESNEMLFRLKEMEYLEKIADKINSISVAGGSQIIDQLGDLFLKK